MELDFFTLHQLGWGAWILLVSVLLSKNKTLHLLDFTVGVLFFGFVLGWLWPFFLWVIGFKFDQFFAEFTGE